MGFSFGNAAEDAVRGWFIGRFVATDGPRRSNDVEVKWGAHPQGEQGHPGWVYYRKSTSISILTEGICVIRVRTVDEDREIRLERPGDYLIVEPGTAHTWEAITACVVLTIRFPSVEDDQIEGLPPST